MDDLRRLKREYEHAMAALAAADPDDPLGTEYLLARAQTLEALLQEEKLRAVRGAHHPADA